MAGEWRRHEVSCLIADNKLFVGDGYRAKNEELSSRGLPFARAANIDNGLRFEDADYFPEDNLARVGNKMSQAGDVVFTSKGTVGRFAFVRSGTPRFVYSPQLCFWRSLDNSTIEPGFLYYWMLGREFFVQFKGVSGQTDMAEYVNLADQRRMHITLPPLAEQRAIAHILGVLDDKIELNRRMDETLEEMARAFFKSWFIDFDPVHRNIARREGQNQPSPQTPLPKGEGLHYRGGYDFSGLVERARALRKQATTAESMFWELLHGRQFLGLKFRRQHQIGDYIADFYCHEHRLVVEFDGGVHGSRARKDHKRDAWMKAQGFRVLRFPNERLLDDPESVLQEIAASFNPLPLGEGWVEGGVATSGPLPLGEGLGEGSVEKLDRLFPDSFQDSALGKIPKGWKAVSLPEVVDVNPARSISKGEEATYLDMQNMPTRGHRPPGWITRPFVSGSRFVNGDTLLARITPCLENGKTAFVDFLEEGEVGWGSTEFIVLHPREPLPAEYGYCLARHEDFREFAIQNMTGSSGRQRVPTDSLAQYTVVRPAEPVARHFRQAVHPLFAKVKANNEESSMLAANREALLPKLISGEIRVKA